MDAFLKIPRPDGETESLGLGRIDEPKLNMSKKSVINLLLQEHGVINSKKYKEVHSIANAHKNPKQITSWVENVDKINNSKHSPQVIYSTKMPNIDDLMQVYTYTDEIGLAARIPGDDSRDRTP